MMLESISDAFFAESRGRNMITITYCDGRRRTMFLSQYKMEQKLGRPLQPGEVTHHINGDQLDDADDNLQLMSRSQHIKVHSPKGFETFVCSWCNRPFTLSGHRLRTSKYNERNRLTGPFCCISHAAKFRYNGAKK